MKCKICNTSAQYAFNGKILNKYNVKYYKCSFCGYLFTEEPFWLSEVYTDAISKFDTGIVARNISLSKKVSIFLTLKNINTNLYVDYSGGYGLFTRLMRDKGFNFFWVDKYAKNIFSEGFEYISNDFNNIGMVTAFECFEHFTDPIKVFDKILSECSVLIFSTVLMPSSVPESGWWYYTFDRGGHISFYSKKTLTFVAEKHNLKFYTSGSFHVIAPKSFLTKVVVFMTIFSNIALLNPINIFRSSYTLLDNEFLLNKNK
jgi:hypothetical protein